MKSSEAPDTDWGYRVMPHGHFFKDVGETIFFVLVFLVLAGCGETPPRPTETILRSIDGGRISVADFEQRVAEIMDRATVSGLGCVILNDGRIVYDQTFGFRDMETGELLDQRSVFNAASFSKPVFAYLVVLLAEDGVIDLDRPIYEYLGKPIPETDNYSDLAGDERWREITARMVLSHSTGFPNWRFLTEEQRLSFLFDPGSRFGYSGEGIQLLQTVIEDLTGLDLESLAKEKVFGPLGMSDSSYVWQPSYESAFALPHNEFGWVGNPKRRSVPAAAGSLTTSAGDFGRFLEAVIARERGAEPGSLAMTDTVLSVTSERMLGPGAQREGDSGDGVSISWGLGWGLFDCPLGRAFFHTGHDIGEQNYTVSFIDQGIGVVLLSNSDNFESVAEELVEAAIGDTYSPFTWLGYQPFDPARRRTPPPRPDRVQVAAEILESYTGHYGISDTEGFWIKADGARLLYSGEGEFWDEIVAESTTRFRFRGQDVTLTFVSGSDGRVDHIEIDYQGLPLSATRVE